MFKTKKSKITALVTILTIFIVVGTAAGYSYYRYNKMLDNMVDQTDHTSQQHQGIDNEKKEKELAKSSLKPFTVMVLGIDSRGEEQARSDTMMLAAIHPRQESVMLLSIPRDTYAFVKDVGYTKFNHSMFYGGPPLVEDTIEGFLDLEVDRYVTIDFEGFRSIVDELNGIDVNVKRRMKYTDPTDGTKIDLHPGEQTLNGDDALDYARFRLSNEGSADTDFERIKRQQEVIKAIVDKGNNPGNFLKIFSFMDILGEHIKTDLTKNQINSLIKVFHDFPSEKLQTLELQGNGARRMAEGYNLWVYVVSDDEKARVKAQVEHFLENGELLLEEGNETSTTN